jgi:hypothetical protein
MEAVHSSKTSLKFYQPTWCHLTVTAVRTTDLTNWLKSKACPVKIWKSGKVWHRPICLIVQLSLGASKGRCVCSLNFVTIMSSHIMFHLPYIIVFTSHFTLQNFSNWYETWITEHRTTLSSHKISLLKKQIISLIYVYNTIVLVIKTFHINVTTWNMQYSQLDCKI